MALAIAANVFTVDVKLSPLIVFILESTYDSVANTCALYLGFCVK